MGDEMFPVQFIEGINEGEQIDNENLFNIQDWPCVAIRYTACLSYLVHNFEILTLCRIDQELIQYEIKVYPDYKGMPNNSIILTDGVLVYGHLDKGNKDTKKWANATLNHNIALISGKTYWIALISKDESMYLGRALQGEKIPILIMNRGSRKWHESSIASDGWECMLRFYGKVIPI
ncbi:MAG: hypothetical protein ABSA18_13380 [Dehalococcoidia bacterium]|jgi:hypothetical protein